MAPLLGTEPVLLSWWLFDFLIIRVGCLAGLTLAVVNAHLVFLRTLGTHEGIFDFAFLKFFGFHLLEFFIVADKGSARFHNAFS